MEIDICKEKVKCDFFGCNNLAKYSFRTKRFFKSELCFCEECLTGLYECIGKTVIPKGIEAPFKKKKGK